MAKNVIHIYGAAGSGTSTLGRRICKELGYKFMDTDDYFWLPTNPPYTTRRDVAERLRMMKEDIENADNVVISGSLVDWGDELIPYFTLVLRLYTDTDIRIERIRKREQEKLGNRIDPGGDMYEHHLWFVDWAASYDTAGMETRSKMKHDAWEKLLLCRQIALNGADTLDKNMERVRQVLNA